MPSVPVVYRHFHRPVSVFLSNSRIKLGNLLTAISTAYKHPSTDSTDKLYPCAPESSQRATSSLVSTAHGNGKVREDDAQCGELLQTLLPPAHAHIPQTTEIEMGRLAGN